MRPCEVALCSWVSMSTKKVAWVKRCHLPWNQVSETAATRTLTRNFTSLPQVGVFVPAISFHKCKCGTKGYTLGNTFQDMASLKGNLRNNKTMEQCPCPLHNYQSANPPSPPALLFLNCFSQTNSRECPPNLPTWTNNSLPHTGEPIAHHQKMEPTASLLSHWFHCCLWDP